MGIFASIFGGGGNETSSNATTSNNTSNTNTTNTSYSTSSNSTVNDTSTVSQDRRIATDHGIGISSDGGAVTTTNSGNSTTNSSSVDNHATYNTMTDYGSVSAAIASNQALALKTIDASRYLTDAGLTLGQSNLDFLQHVSDNNAATARAAVGEVVAASTNALNQVVGIAAKPLNAQDPQHILVIVGLAVVGLVFFSKMKA